MCILSPEMVIKTICLQEIAALNPEYLSSFKDKFREREKN